MTSANSCMLRPTVMPPNAGATVMAIAAPMSRLWARRIAPPERPDMPASSITATSDLNRLARLAIACHARTGAPHCIVQHRDGAPPFVLSESDVVAAGPVMIDAILWSTDTAETDGLDPALLA